MVWVLKRLSNLWQINEEGKIADFGFKNGKDFGKQAAHPHPNFMGDPGFIWHKQAVFRGGFSDSIRLSM